MAGLNETPKANRVHIAFFGLRNAGKSTLVNAFAGQDIAIVSDVAGTTTDHLLLRQYETSFRCASVLRTHEKHDISFGDEVSDKWFCLLRHLYGGDPLPEIVHRLIAAVLNRGYAVLCAFRTELLKRFCAVGVRAVFITCDPYRDVRSGKNRK